MKLAKFEIEDLTYYRPEGFWRGDVSLSFEDEERNINHNVAVRSRIFGEPSMSYEDVETALLNHARTVLARVSEELDGSSVSGLHNTVARQRADDEARRQRELDEAIADIGSK